MPLKKPPTHVEIAQSEITKYRERTYRDIGVLGRFFGKGYDLPNFFAALVLISLIIYGAIFSYLKGGLEVWNIILPILTLFGGYLFGKFTSISQQPATKQ